MKFRGGGLLLLGALPGLLFAIVTFGPELIRRWSWAANGGGGETAAWGEPLFFLILVAFICSGAGIMLAAFIAWIMQ